MPTEPSFSERFRYRFDNFMAKGGSSIFISLFIVFLISLAIIAGLRLMVYSGMPAEDERGSDFLQNIYITWLQMTDPGNMAQDIKSPQFYKTTAVIAGAAGVIILSMLIGLITTALDQKMQQLRKGHSKVIEDDHTLILGWNDQRILEILRELVMANESEDNPSAVILADQDKSEMDDYFALMMPNTENTRVVTRSGSPSSVPNLKISAVDKCRSVIVLATANEGASDKEKAISDARVIKTIMAVVAAREKGEDLNIVAEIFDDKRRSIVQENSPFPIAVVDSADVLAKIIVQTSRSVGLSVVYGELLSFDGCEMYFYNDPKWAGKTFFQISYHFPDGVPMGVRDAKGRLFMNPPFDRLLAADDEILIVADDDSTIEYVDTPVAKPRDLPLHTARMEQRVEHELFIGWNRKASIMIEEYADYVIAGSTIDVITAEATNEVREEIARLNAELETLTITLTEKDPMQIENLAELRPELRDNIILLSDGGDGVDSEEVDSRSIMILLLLRRLFNESGGIKSGTQLITEVMDSNNQHLVSSAGVKDFIISDRFVSMLLAQMSEEADIKRVYDDLFQEDGSEIYLKPVGLYLTDLPTELSFADCMGLAAKREEVCIGVKLKSKESDPDENYGVKLIPEKNEKFTFGPDDCFVVLAEDET